MSKKVLKNMPYPQTPIIMIVESSEEWDAAYKTWLGEYGKPPQNPTPDWKLGVYMGVIDE